VKAPPRPGDLVEIGPTECLDLLASAPYVRIAFVVDDGPTVLPINLVLHAGGVYFRTAAGSKLGSAAASGRVAIEADGGDESTRVAWSVVIHGTVSILTDPTIEEELHALPDEPWALPDSRSFWVRVDVDRISGRRIVRP
jgi:uncharacterized protein